MKLNSWGGDGKNGWGPKEKVFGPQLPRTGFWQVTLPLSIIHGYRKIPCGVRGVWSMGSSTSHLAEAAVEAGGGWSSFRRYSGGWKFLPAYAVGAGLRHAGALKLVARLDKRPWDWSDGPDARLISVETHGWGKSPYPPLPFMGGGWGAPSNWPSDVSGRGEPYTSPWYGHSSMGSGGWKSAKPGKYMNLVHQPPGFEWSFRRTDIGPTRITYSDITSAGWTFPSDKDRYRPRRISYVAHWRDSTPNWRNTSAGTDRGELPDWFPTTGMPSRGWLASSIRSEGWGDPFKHVSVKSPWNMPGESVKSDWDTPRNAIRYFLVGGFLSGFFGGR